ncbi:hypothetical protein PGB34_09515 [Xenophilus arseniciresistens]|uniref:Uncharacterized protein n=1 Tax=Xenophilus arseniciresistens TaxID=1283306 RepID=A0AAE3T066_9BURK|nr:hypothetical protein [Xenophilus arseniciresistens]MDA7416601.1 hypothetical protein [Xenophilus arseniciresistens]
MPPDTASSPAATLTVPRSLRPAGAMPGQVPPQRQGSEAVSRFGAAAYLLDRLDTRPIEQRQPQRPWWRLW